MNLLPTHVAPCYHSTAPALTTTNGIPSITTKAELKIRQTTNAVGTDTCGWIDGDPISSVTCPSGFGCGAISTYVGCTPNAIYTSCYDLLGPTCDQNCQNVLANLYCGNDYCAQFDYPSGSIGYGCATISGYTKTVLLTTTSRSATSLSFGGTNTSPTTPETSSSSAVPVSSSSSSSLSSGAIAGIVIGSVATIVFICGLAFMIFAHRKKNRKSHDVAFRESAMSLSPNSNGPSSQARSGHLSGSTFYDNATPTFEPRDGPWPSISPKPIGELEADFPHEKDASDYDPSSMRYSEPSTRS